MCKCEEDINVTYNTVVYDDYDEDNDDDKLTWSTFRNELRSRIYNGHPFLEFMLFTSIQLCINSLSKDYIIELNSEMSNLFSTLSYFCNVWTSFILFNIFF